ncbi:right-handed parallel beta-helix repeat-containing protein [Agromyces bauzanensis]
MSALGRFLRTLAFGVLIVAVAIGGGILFRDVRQVEDAFGRNEIAANGTVQGRLYPGDPQREAELVSGEAARLDYVRTVGSSIPWHVDGIDGPYRVPTAPASTLVLPARETPYTFEDLRELAPETLVERPDGSFLLSEHVVVLSGAVLDVTSESPLTINMASSADSFVSLVAIGGTLKMTGTEAAPVTVASRDTASGAPDEQTADGRAYVRVIGGTAELSHARFSDLGFWSGNTGGLSLTGVEDSSQDLAADAPLTPSEVEGGGAPTLTPEELEPLLADDQPEPGPVTASLHDVWTTGNAFGLFVSRATEVTVTDSRIHNSLIDGVVFHRFVTASTLEATQSIGNAVDGVVIDRSSSSIQLSDVTSSDNGRNGISVDGQPLADGPSAAGTPVAAYGDVHVGRSTVADNARYGIEVSGGDGMTIADTHVAAGTVGIALNHGARNVEVTGNTLENQERQSIALRQGVEDVRIEGNAISSVDTGVHVRNAAATVSQNSFADVSNHAVTLVGTATGTQVSGNTIVGHGSTPVYDDAIGGHITGNDVEGWETPPTVASVLSTFFQPLTIIWVALGLLLLFTALTGHRRRGIRHPYADRIPLTELSEGVVSPETLRGAR